MSTRTTWSDLVCVAALVTVVAALALGSPWSPLVLPAVGVLLAHGGRAAARELDRAARTRAFLRRRAVALLLPVWLFAAAGLGLRLLGGPVGPDGGTGLAEPDDAWLWLLPLAEPPSPDDVWTATLWVVPLYLWLLVLTPPLLWLFRRWPVRVALVPLAVLGVLVVGLGTLGDRVGQVVVGLCVYAPCWLLGFTAHDGTLRRLRRWESVVVAAAAIGGVLWYLLPRRDEYTEYTVATLPWATVVVSAAAALVLLRLPPPRGGWQPPAPLRPLFAVPAFVAGRPLTSLLWAGAAVSTASVLLATISPGGRPAEAGWLSVAAAFAVLLAVVAVAGWLESVPRRGGRRRATRVQQVPPPRRYELRDNVVQSDVPQAVNGTARPDVSWPHRPDGGPGERRDDGPGGRPDGGPRGAGGRSRRP